MYYRFPATNLHQDFFTEYFENHLKLPFVLHHFGSKSIHNQYLCLNKTIDFLFKN